LILALPKTYYEKCIFSHLGGIFIPCFRLVATVFGNVLEYCSTNYNKKARQYRRYVWYWLSFL